MRRALDMFVIEGIHTSIPLHQRILADPISRPAASIPASSNRFLPAAKTVKQG